MYELDLWLPNIGVIQIGGSRIDSKIKQKFFQMTK